MEKLVLVDGAAPLLPGEAPAPGLGFPHESWREYAEHCFEHDPLPDAPETRHGYAESQARERERVQLTVPAEDDLAWAREKYPRA
jgi:hypothetical protein